MESTKKKSVGIQLLAKSNDSLVAILQVRSKWNSEKNVVETWPGACQVTVHGKLEEGEDFMGALLREIEEELGDEVATILRNLAKEKSFEILINDDHPEKQVITYGVIVDESVLHILTSRAKSSTFGGFKIIRREGVDKIIDLRTIDKTTGVTDANTIAMFPDEKEAVLVAFERLG